ncbi:MAG TPA: glycoside hydrolase family 18 protein, partial [Acidobacteriaceae bacterium]|nr:glycoside hydrolase family 18 protein [Acidobacteriaceae bacterium]
KAQNPSLTVLVSVGGWLWSGNFSEMCLTAESRRVFIDSVMAFLDRYKLDGLDIDWEYPGLEGATKNFRPEDKENFTALVKELRERFEAKTRTTHRHLILTMAAGSSTEFLTHTEMDKVARYMDDVNLMAYDYYEPSESGGVNLTGHHAPLYANPADPKKASTDESIREFLQAGVPADKIVLGVPFYGHTWGHVAATNHGLYQKGQMIPHVYSSYGSLAAQLKEPNSKAIRYWDDAASVPYIYNAEAQTFTSYEDPQSIKIKCRYVLDHHLAGVMFWDYESDPTGALLHAVDESLDLSNAKRRRP